MKKLKEIAVEASHKAQGVEVFFAGARRVFQGRLGLYLWCVLCKEVSFQKPGITPGRYGVGKREREIVVFSPPQL